MKNVIIFLLILYGQLIFADINTRLVYVSNTRDNPSPGLSTLVFDVESISTSGDVQINVFQDAIQIDANFISTNPTVFFTNQLFPSSDYNTTEDYRASDGRIRFVYTYDSGTTGTINSTFTRVLTISIQYTTVNSTGSIYWFSELPNYNAADGSNVFITGAELSIPSELNILPLPVELSSFTGKVIEDEIVELNWVTKTEVNNYGFNVERSINESEWSSLGFVEGHGNSNSPKEYSYSDKDLFLGGSKFQYRLKQLDTDGKYEYSNVIELEIVPTKFALYQNHPNPFNPVTKIKFSLPEVAKVSIRIYNMLGELVDELVNQEYEAGYHKVEFNAANYASGVYIYSLVTNNFTDVKKMLLVK